MKYVLITCFSIFLLSITQAQNRVYRHYATQQVHARLLTEQPTMRQSLSQIERHVQQYRLVGNMPQITIPVVVHVLYNNQTERVSEQRIMDQLAVLNQALQGN